MHQSTLDGWLCRATHVTDVTAQKATDVPNLGGLGGAVRLAKDAAAACDVEWQDNISKSESKCDTSRTRAHGVACAHGRRRCRECGKGYCPCGMRRDDCRQCGIRFCPCGRRKDCCAKCGGSQVRLRVYLDADKIWIQLCLNTPLFFCPHSILQRVS